MKLQHMIWRQPHGPLMLLSHAGRALLEILPKNLASATHNTHEFRTLRSQCFKLVRPKCSCHNDEDNDEDDEDDEDDDDDDVDDDDDDDDGDGDDDDDGDESVDASLMMTRR
eukprot:809513-Amphidinium_carterae.1